MTGPEIRDIYREHLQEIGGPTSSLLIMSQSNAGIISAVLTLAQVISQQTQPKLGAWMDDEIEHMRAK